MTVIDDVRTLDPVSYIRQLRLRPEDSYGFLPMRLGEGSSVLYLYRDRPEYEQARPKLEPPVEARRFGPIEIKPTQTVEMEAPAEGAGDMFGDIIAEAQKLQQTYGGVGSAPPGAPGDPPPAPDPERLARIAKLRESGAIDDAEDAKLRAEAGVLDPAADASGPTETATAEGGAAIVAHRIYPGMRMRSSARQLNRFLPRYRDTVGVHPEDVYGIFPWGTRASHTSDSTSTEWDDYWIVYRDRPEYAAGRDAYAAEMDKKGRWPQPVIAPGTGEAPAAAPPVES